MMPDDLPRFLPVIQRPQAGAAVPTTPPVFERIAIVGVGAVGGSIALAARRAWPSALVIGLDRHDVLERAMVAHAVDVASTDPMIVSEADLVVLATPVEEIIRLIPGLPSQLAGEAVVTDVASVKGPVAAAAAALPARLAFVGGHPLAGVEAGFAHARPDLFAGRPWLLAPSGAGGASQAPFEKLSSFVAGLGAVPVVLPSAEAHDEWVASIDRVIAGLEALRPGLGARETLERLLDAALERRAFLPRP